MSGLPERVVFVDVETTGLSSDDRIVSLGALSLRTRSIGEGQLDLRTLHLVCNPGRPSHPRATAVHGYHDRTLRIQERFAENAAVISRFVNDADLVVAHNAQFDLGFLNRELAASGVPDIRTPAFCTMQHQRARGRGSASLDAVCAHIGLVRSGALHDALEDAWLAMAVYLWQQGISLGARYPEGDHRKPSNLRGERENVVIGSDEEPLDALLSRPEPPLRAVPGIGLQGPAEDADPDVGSEESIDVDGLAIGIVYRDVSGQKSVRTIRCEAIHLDDGNVYVEAWCLMRGARRTFRMDRVESIFDYQTGELLGDAGKFFAPFLPVTWQARQNGQKGHARNKGRDLIKVFGDGARILLYLAMEDGELHSAEHNLILDYALSRLHQAGLRDFHSEAQASGWIRNHLPSRRAAKIALGRIMADQQHASEMAHKIVDLIVADGRTTDDEMKAAWGLVAAMEKRERQPPKAP